MSVSGSGALDFPFFKFLIEVSVGVLDSTDSLQSLSLKTLSLSSEVRLKNFGALATASESSSSLTFSSSKNPSRDKT